jgi:hypothetical protein
LCGRVWVEGGVWTCVDDTKRDRDRFSYVCKERHLCKVPKKPVNNRDRPTDRQTDRQTDRPKKRNEESVA